MFHELKNFNCSMNFRFEFVVVHGKCMIIFHSPQQNHTSIFTSNFYRKIRLCHEILMVTEESLMGFVNLFKTRVNF